VKSRGFLTVYLRPTTLEEAVEALWQSGGEVLAGGTDFYPALGERIPTKPVVDITRVRELRGITSRPDSFRIGGGTTWTEVIKTPLPRCFDALKAAAREIGSVQIQNRGTVAGNLCNASPAADSVPALLVVDAEVELASRDAIRRVPVKDFILGNRKTVRRSDEILSAVIVPRTLENAASAFLKLGARRYLVISISMIAVVLDIKSERIQQVRVAVGSCSERAQRLTELEQELIDAPLGKVAELVAARHVQVLSPINDVRATADYRLDSALTLVRRALQQCAATYSHGDH
jgi:CO/xanthine dehydrogenase FAD-binding subunit